METMETWPNFYFIKLKEFLFAERTDLAILLINA